MSPADARHTAALINQAHWPPVVTVEAEALGSRVAVAMTAPGVVPARFTLRKPIGLFGWRYLRELADDMAEDADALTLVECDCEPEPDWLRSAVRGIEARTAGRPGLGRFATEIARCLEFDDIPSPQVVDFQGISIVLRWRHEGRVLEIGAGIDGEVKIIIADAYGANFVASYPYVGTDFRDRGQVWANLRSAVASVLCLKAVTKDAMEEELVW